ncbi:MAG: hypothetical protein BWY73_00137 [candidate division TA06 bacterium ADurb.Bin417]|uniref:CRISPR-associated protein Cas6 C-terminal domain-containing protein n=1 Tax=candidate division TA06 bacterium ADurb.Bin417 TaxID=1852828 RepID=A0A1V5MKH3_UNCT6|nr:MAG: hypothetical protein BWY73_00137 [candidate division TA06 bacterium ADurb.Bin417]
MATLPEVTLNGYRFSLTALQPIPLPAYKGATFRGAFGYALRRAICTQPGRKCPGCLLHTSCVYPFIFEPSADLFPDPVQKRFRDFPRPFVIRPPRQRERLINPGRDFNFELILIGRAIDYLPYFVFAFRELGQAGLGVARSQFQLKETRDFSGNPVYDGQRETLSRTRSFLPMEPAAPAGQKITLDFLTPGRLRETGDLVVHPTFRQLFQSLLFRADFLARHYCGWNNGTQPDYRELLEMASRIRTGTDRLHWYDWGRFSTRQKTGMKLGGFLGRITFSGELDPFLPLLNTGQYIHLGKGSTFGLGQYYLEAGEPAPLTTGSRPGENSNSKFAPERRGRIIGRNRRPPTHANQR